MVLHYTYAGNGPRILTGEGCNILSQRQFIEASTQDTRARSRPAIGGGFGLGAIVPWLLKIPWRRICGPRGGGFCCGDATQHPQWLLQAGAGIMTESTDALVSLAVSANDGREMERSI